MICQPNEEYNIYQIMDSGIESYYLYQIMDNKIILFLMLIYYFYVVVY